MKFSGTITVQAPRAQVYKALRDARLFASCVEGVRDLVETGSHAEVARQGKQRLEGKTYVVRDGDVLNIRFNV